MVIHINVVLHRFSQYPDEQEVLLTISYPFTIDKIENDEASGKWLIYLREFLDLGAHDIDIDDTSTGDHTWLFSECDLSC